MKVAEISPVKILGVLCLIDEGAYELQVVFSRFCPNVLAVYLYVVISITGEADWKIIAISCSDPWSGLLNDVSDIERLLPGTLDSIREWFRTYKAFDGKPPNEFGMGGEFQNAAFAKKIVDHAHMSWRKLVSGHYDRMPSDDLADGELPQRIKTRLLSIPDQSLDNNFAEMP
jgi:inorganic pyrophosphatase